MVAGGWISMIREARISLKRMSRLIREVFCVCLVTLILPDISMLDSGATRKYFIIRKNLASFPITHNAIVPIKSFL
jgi:hypothetical protein